MSLSTERLSAALDGRYRILRALGAGGMATVYLAEDLKHDRKVAVKVLKPELAAVLGAERFVVEIKTTAALQHPHILPLFDSGTADGFLFYVMPYIEGETLREKLNRETQLSVDEALRITREIADALHYAHQRGVIHRDIKPENILLANGRPMVADFGIALAVSAAAGGRMTETGLSLGTPHYMSPEQATADKDISARSDVYSLASVCYEMLAGQPPHLGGSAQQIIMKIIAEPVEPVTRYRKNVPEHVSAVLSQALEKLPADRFESAEAFAQGLADRGFATTASSGARRFGPSSTWHTRAAVPLAVAATAFLVAAVWGWSRPSGGAGTQRPVWLSVDPPHGRFAVLPNPSVSPDGRRLAFLAPDADGALRFWVRDLGSAEATPVSEGLLFPNASPQQAFWSPDSRSLAFFADNALYRSDLDGRAPLRLAVASNPRGGTWNADGVILFVPATSGLHRVSASGGTVVPVGDTLLAANTTDRWPHFLPDGRHFLFLRREPGKPTAVLLGSLDDPATRPILDVSSRAEYADGHLFFVRDAALFAQPFDLTRLALSGQAVRVTDNVGGSGADYRNAAFSVGAGTVVTWTGGYSPVARIAVVDASGRELRQIGPPAPYHDIDVDPSGRRIAIERGDQKTVVPSIWLMDVASGQSSVLAAPAEGGGTPRWIPGTTDVIYSTFTARALVRQSTTSSESRSFPAPTAWMTDVSPDGRTALFLTSRPGTGEDVLQVALEADGGLSPFLAGPMGERSAVISPDAQWVAYASDESGRSEVSVEAYPGRGRKWVVSSGGGHQPQWSADGRTLYYLTDDSAFVAAAVERRGGSLSFSPRRLFRLPAIVNLNDVRQTYEPLRDGTFLVILRRDTNAIGSLRVGLNWAAR